MHVLYRFYDTSDQLLYVGMTINPGRRLERHRDTKDWWPTVARVEMQQLNDRNELLAAERHAIESEQPLYNIRMNGNGTGDRPVLPQGEKLPKSIQLMKPYALALRDGRCPVGIVIRGDEDGIVITKFDWFIGSFSGDDEWISAEAIVGWVEGYELSEGAKRKEGWDPKRTVFEMQPLGDYQTRWIERHKDPVVTN